MNGNLKEKVKRGAKINKAQKEQLLSYMETHSRLAKSQMCGSNGNILADQMWTALAARLNSDGSGATKTVDKWKDVSNINDIIPLTILQHSLQIPQMYMGLS